MAITTMIAHVSRAIDFYNKDSIYFCIGKKTEWSADDIDNFSSSVNYDLNPPVPKSTDTMKEIIGYKKVEFKAIVKPDEENGTIDYRNTKWRIVSADKAIEEGARWVYMSSVLLYEELPTESAYREIGLYTDLKVRNGISSDKYALLPNEVSDSGMLQVIDYRKPIYRDTDVKENLKIILEF